MPQDAASEDSTKDRARFSKTLLDISAADPEIAIATRDASRITGLAEITLAQMRARGEGPPFFRVGERNIRYRLADVLAWRDARLVGKRP
jgi:predicted DNA-binding transcriptional regulator AlpA